MLARVVYSILFFLCSSGGLLAENSWSYLIDPELKLWDVFMGVPHTSVEGLDEYEKREDPREGTPIGLNKDPKKVFTVIRQEEENVLRISGEIFAGLVTKEEFSNYHFSAQFKWGTKKWEPWLKHAKNNGILYHSVGSHTDFWKVWMTSLECEIQLGNCGDLITIGRYKAKIRAAQKDKHYFFKPEAALVQFSWGEEFPTGRCRKPGDPEKLEGEWNTMELYCFENTNIHVLNGEVVMVVIDPEVNLGDGWKPSNRGRIQLQSEYSEIFYKELKIRPITEIPTEIREKIRL